MSGYYPDIPNDKEAAKAYIKSLLAHPFVKEVLIKGSRSPLSKKEPRPTSDWDIEVISDKKIKFADPRKWKFLNADVHVTKKPSLISVPWEQVINE